MSLLGILPDRSGPAAALPEPPVPPPPTAGSVPVAPASGTPVTAPATRHSFAPPDKPREDRDAASQRKWRMSDIVAAIGGGPRAEILIEAASRPGPAAPGSLIEAIKALRPAPSLPQSTWTV